MTNLKSVLRLTMVFVGVLLIISGCARRQVGQKQIIRNSLDLYHEALDLQEQGDFVGAEEKLRSSLEISPRPIVYLELGHVLAEQGKFDEAVAEINNAYKLVKEFPAADAEIERINAQRKLASLEEPKMSVEEKLPEVEKVEPIKTV